MMRATDLVLVLAMLLNFLVLGSSRLSAGIRAVALQGASLSLLPLLLHDGGAPTIHLMALGLGMLGLKGMLFPWLLFRAIREASMRREMQPLIGFTASLVAGILAAAVAFRVSTRLPLPSAPVSSFLIPTALTTILVSFIVLVSRTKALTQVLGYLMLENGIFLFGLVFAREMPLLIELGILLDLFVGVFVMGIVVFHIHREFDHIDTVHLTTLKG
ncbi:MAG: hydrogenase [Candidatus Omnitrophica bacterium CG11_big_fil_rev_8_21_14_0_20_64_10]|nr:MAG: hydrogenase [Candidatus Omnitrophica bacterium CG11_big_fil_rev_8_21_14_0_20_64_10]